jgi:hypothetical protein
MTKMRSNVIVEKGVESINGEGPKCLINIEILCSIDNFSVTPSMTDDKAF